MFKDSDVGLSSSKVLEQTINWRQYADSKLINEADLGLMGDYDKQLEEDQATMFDERGGELAQLFIKILCSISHEPTKQYVLALIDLLLTKDENRRRAFHGIHSSSNNCYQPFFSILTRGTDHPYTIAKACRILSILLAKDVDGSSREIEEYFQAIFSRLDTARGVDLLVSVSSLKIMLRNPDSHAAFFKLGGPKVLIPLLRVDTQNTQLMYFLAFCIWLLTFNTDNLPLLAENEVCLRLAEVLRAVLKEKVVRVVMASLRNLLDRASFNEQMISAGLSRILPALAARKWNDEDLVSDLDAVSSKLEQAVAEFSSYERYSAEILSGNLEWSPVHNEKFWRENVHKFENDNLNLIRCLISLLDSEDGLTLEVA